MIRQQFRKNMLTAVVAQAFNYLFSLVMALLIPKLLGVEQFGYWQLFIFYSTYVGLFHFGLSDGVYLKYGGKTYDYLRPFMIGGQFWIMIGWLIMISLTLIPISTYYCKDIDRRYVWGFIAIYMIVANATWFLGYVFQAVNKTMIYSESVIIARVIYLVSLVLLNLVNIRSYRAYIFFYVLAQIIALSFTLFHARKLIFFKVEKIRECFSDMLDNMKIGINLTISNIVSSFVLGIGRVMVDSSNGIKTFSILSFSITLCNFFLQFITQISMVLFPALRMTDKEISRSLFVSARKSLGYANLAIFAMYAPIKWILLAWLPNYRDSFFYMIFLFPICIFDGKMQLLFNTYLKVYRKERLLLYINLMTLFCSSILCAISIYCFHSIGLVATSMMVAILFRSVIANLFLSRILDVENDKHIYYEFFFMLIFVIGNVVLPDLNAFIVYLLMLIMFIFFKRKDIWFSYKEFIECYRTFCSSSD